MIYFEKLLNDFFNLKLFCVLDNLCLVNLYLAALGLYKLGIDIASSRGGQQGDGSSAQDAKIVAFIKRNFEYCVQQGDSLCNGQEEMEDSAESLIYSRALELVCVFL